MARESDTDSPPSSARLPSPASERELPVASRRAHVSDEFLEKTKVMPGAPVRPQAEAAMRRRLLMSTPQSFAATQLSVNPGASLERA